MKLLSDEILNKYIDGELDEKSAAEVKQSLNDSEENRKRLHELQTVDSELRNMKEFKVRDNFTFQVMQKIKNSAKLKQKDKRFIAVIATIILVLSLAVVIYAFYLILPEAGISAATNQSIDNHIDYFVKQLISFDRIFNSQNISIIGSVFSLGLLISGYFFFETQRANKKR